MLGQTWGAPHASLLVESRFDEGVIEQLRAAGHDVEVLAQAYADSMGHAGAVLLHPNGTLEGAHDPRERPAAAGQSINLAEGRKFWSFKPPVAPTVPEIKNAGWMRTPIQPRSTFPVFCSCSMTGRASEAGMAKPMPIEPPEGE